MELSKGLHVQEFLILARDAQPNTNEAIGAQRYFKKNLMGINDTDLLSASPCVSGNCRKFRAAYIDAVEQVSAALNGPRFQTAAPLDTILSGIPKSETGVHHTLRKVGLQFGMCTPR